MYSTCSIEIYLQNIYCCEQNNGFQEYNPFFSLQPGPQARPHFIPRVGDS